MSPPGPDTRPQASLRGRAGHCAMAKARPWPGAPMSITRCGSLPVPAPPPGKAARSVVGVPGGRFPAEPGIDADAGNAGAGRWFPAAALPGTRIPAGDAKRALAMLNEAGPPGPAGRVTCPPEPWRAPRRGRPCPAWSSASSTARVSTPSSSLRLRLQIKLDRKSSRCAAEGHRVQWRPKFLATVGKIR